MFFLLQQDMCFKNTVYNFNCNIFSFYLTVNLYKYNRAPAFVLKVSFTITLITFFHLHFAAIPPQRQLQSYANIYQMFTEST